MEWTWSEPGVWQLRNRHGHSERWIPGASQVGGPQCLLSNTKEGGGESPDEKKKACLQAITCVPGLPSPAKCFGILVLCLSGDQRSFFKSDVMKDDFLGTMGPACGHSSGPLRLWRACGVPQLGNQCIEGCREEDTHAAGDAQSGLKAGARGQR